MQINGYLRKNIKNATSIRYSRDKMCQTDFKLSAVNTCRKGHFLSRIWRSKYGIKILAGMKNLQKLRERKNRKNGFTRKTWENQRDFRRFCFDWVDIF